ncbi:hypothetical protein GCM10011452_33310 [Gemmobacter lanyuensis]|uniref:histidine kinase n=1 Tax=Gemmobacter lanyuensis TaxID=1054497 RepID=A0A918J0Y3_9RHOB|nr:ATP-binding protein [Gemmobacter lanyuensis]GGW42272.1 hypothetical protein GCM10011452_33310 [Gemmobacter lanyuensis]
MTPLALIRSLIVALAVLATAAEAQDPVGTGRSLKIGMPIDRPPFSFLHEAGQLDGQRIALWQAMGERTGIRIIPHAVPTESALTALNDGRVDAVDLFAQSTAPGFGIRIMAPEEILRFVEFQRMKNGKLPAEDSPVAVVEGSACDNFMSDQATSRVLRYPNPQGVVLAAAIAEADRFCLSEPTGILLLRQAGLQDAFTHGEPISITRTATAYRLSDPDTGILLAELAASLTPEERKQIIDNWRRENRIDSVGLTDGGIILPLAGLIAGVLILLLLAMLLRFRLWRARAWAEMTRSSLARSEARFSTAFENTGLPVMVLREGRIYRINDAARQLLGYHDAAELIGRQPAEISPPIQPDGRSTADLGQEILAALNTGGRTRTDWTHLRADGSSITTEVLLTKVPTRQGFETIAVLTDVTAQRQAEETLRAYQSRLESAVAKRTEELESRNEELRAIFDTSRSGILFLREHRVVQANTLIHHQLGRTNTGLTGLLLTEVLDGAPTFWHDNAEVLAGIWQGRTVELTTELRRPDGTSIWARMRAAAVDPDDPEKGEVWVLDDITAEREAEDLLRNARDLATQTAQLKSDFLSTMSHEIRTPLNSLIGFLDLLAETQLDPKQTAFLSKAARSGQHLAAIVNDILDLSKAEAGKLALERVTVNLRDLARDALEGIAPTAGRRGIDLVLNVAPDVPATIQADPLRLTQVLMNYLSNAVKFTEAGEITLSISHVREDRPMLRLAVSDTGVGLNEEQVQRLFQAFTQAEHSTARLYGGTGLGLAICRQLATLMGGEVGVRSQEGEGSEFWLQIHLDDAEPSAPPAVPVGEGRVAVAIANENLRALICNQLRRCGFDAGLVLGLADRSVIGLEGADLAVVDDAFIHRVPESIALLQQGSRPVLALMDSDDPHLTPIATEILRKPADPLLIAERLAQMRRGGAQIPRPVAEPEQHPALRVLVADDDGLNRDLAAARLERLGLSVITAANGAEAVRAVLEDRIDLVLMDHQMPVMDGIEAARRIRALGTARGEVPILAVSGAEDDDVKAACLAAGMNGFLKKPLDNRQLRAALQQWLPGFGASAGA